MSVVVKFPASTVEIAFEDSPQVGVGFEDGQGATVEFPTVPEIAASFPARPSVEVSFDASGQDMASYMAKATYDPTNVGGDVFDLANHTGVLADENAVIDCGTID